MKIKHTFLSLALLFLLGCNQKSTQQLSLPAMQSERISASSYDLSVEQTVERKIIYNASIEVIVEEPDSVARDLIESINRDGGLLQSRQNLTLNFKVKPEAIDTIFKSLKALGTTKNEYVRTQDVTDSFYDTEARLKNLIDVRNRYQDLLEKASTVQDILSVEKELERVNSQIDVLQGRLDRIEKDVNLASLTVTLREKKKAGILGAIGKGIYSGIKWLFIRN